MPGLSWDSIDYVAGVIENPAKSLGERVTSGQRKGIDVRGGRYVATSLGPRQHWEIELVKTRHSAVPRLQETYPLRAFVSLQCRGCVTSQDLRGRARRTATKGERVNRLPNVSAGVRRVSLKKPGAFLPP